MRFDIITIFPKIFDSYFGESIVKRAKEKGIVEINIHNLRDYSTNKHHNVDDTPYGGGAGMVMQVEPIYRAVADIQKANLKTRTILFSAKGKRYKQKDAKRLSQYDQLIFVCGRYEGVDERVAGGEIPAMLVVDSISRLLPGVLGNDQSAVEESHSEEGYLEFPQYTKPEKFLKWEVPSILLSGNHGEIERWRKTNSKETKNKKQ